MNVSAIQEQEPARFRRGIVSVVVLSLAAAASLFGAAPASAAPGVLTSVALSVTSDGTAPFSASDGPGLDSSASNGVVRTNDSVTYRWEYAIATAGDVTFIQALPAGMRWEPSSTASCLEGAGAIDTSGSTLTCTLPELASGTGAYPVTATVLTVPDSSLLESVVTSGAFQSAPAIVTASAAPRLAPDLQTSGATAAANGPGDSSDIAGYNIAMTADLFMPIDSATGTRGLEPGATPLTFQIVLPGNFAGGLLAAGTNCTTNTGEAPLGGGGGSSAVVDSGAVVCAQAGGAGSPITVTFESPDQTLSSYPTNIGSHNPGAYFAASRIVVWFPASSFPVGVVTTGTFQLTGFAPLGATGAANYGGFAPGQEPGAACETVPARNCVSVNVLRAGTPQLSGGTALTTSSTAFSAPLPDASSATSNDGPIYFGQDYYGVAAMNTTAASPDAFNARSCITWDPALHTIDAERAPNATRNGGSTTNVVLEYGNTAYPDDAARRGPNCGSAGDAAAGWFANIAEAGGPGAVTAVRVRFLDPAPGSTGMNLFVPFTRTEIDTAPGTPIPIFSNFTADDAPIANSSYNPATNTGANGARGLAADAKVRANTTWDTESAQPGEAHEITITPTVTNDYVVRTAVDVVITTTLSTPCASFQTGSASRPPSSITPATVNCAGGGVGQTITWNLGPVPTGTALAPITFTAVLDPATPFPASGDATTVIASPSDPAREAVRTSNDELIVNAVAEFTVTKTASVAAVAPGVPFTYTIGWANRLATSVGTASFVDVLPFAGDIRGTAGLGDLSVESVEPRDGTTGVAVTYTEDPSANVEAAIAVDPSGATGINWVSAQPPTVTAIRFITPELTPGTVQAMDITLTAVALARSGVMVNDVWGEVTEIPIPITAAAAIELESAASEVSGFVFHDIDRSGDLSAGDTPVVSPVVQIIDGYSYGANGIDDGGGGDDIALASVLTADSSADGTYLFPSVSAGSYAVTVVPPTGTSLAILPPLPVRVAPNTSITDVDFGVRANADAGSSRIVADPVVIIADGVSTSTITVSLLDENGNPVTDAGDVVTMSTDAGTLGPVTDNGDGTYTAMLTSSTTVETATIGFAVDEVAGDATATVDFIAGPPAPPNPPAPPGPPLPATGIEIGGGFVTALALVLLGLVFLLRRRNLRVGTGDLVFVPSLTELIPGDGDQR